MDFSLPGFCVQRILQTRTLEWISIPFCMDLPCPRGVTQVSHIAGRLSTIWATRKRDFFIFLICVNHHFWQGWGGYGAARQRWSLKDLMLNCLQLLLPPIPPNIRVFSSESTLCSRWPCIGVSALASVLPMNTQDWSPWIDWLDLLAVQRTLKSLLQHHSSKASFLWCSAFFTVQLSHMHDHWENHSLD